MDSTAPLYEDDSDGELEVGSQPEAGPSRLFKRRKVLVEICRPAKKHQQVALQDLDDEFDEEARGAAKIIPTKAKDKGKSVAKEKGKDPGPDQKEVPLSKMGPPRGVKRPSTSTALHKSNSIPSSSKPYSKSDESSNTKKAKPSPARFRSPSAPHHISLYADESPSKSRSRKQPQNIDDNSEMDLSEPLPLEHPKRQSQLFSPSSDDEYSDYGVESHDPAPPTMPNTTTDDTYIDYDAIPQSGPVEGLSSSKPGRSGVIFSVLRFRRRSRSRRMTYTLE